MLCPPNCRQNSLVVWNQKLLPKSILRRITSVRPRLAYRTTLYAKNVPLDSTLLVVQIISTKPLISRPSRKLLLIAISIRSRSTSRKRFITRPLQHLYSRNSQLRKYTDSHLRRWHGNPLIPLWFQNSIPKPSNTSW